MRKTNKKGAIELSITTIIIIVIGVAILSLGLKWVYGIFANIQATSQSAFENVNTQLDNLLSGSEDILVIYPETTTIKQRETGDIGIAIQNLISDGKPHTFTYKIDLVNKEGKDVNAVLGWLTKGGGLELATGETVALGSGKKVKKIIPIEIPRNAPLGTYRFKVILTADNPEGNDEANFLVIIKGEE